MSKSIFTLGLLLTISFTNALRTGQKQTFDKQFDNNQQPGTMILDCNKAKPIWTFQGGQPLVNSQSNPLFTISGGRLLNAQVTSGDYNGNYLCLDGDGESAGIEFNVRINGTSNLSAGAIVGIVFAILFAIVIIVVGLYLAKQKGFLGGDENQYDEDEKLHGNDVEVDDYDRNSHAGRFRSAGQTSQLT